MKVIVKDKVEYAEFEHIRDDLYKNVPFAIVHIGYSAKLQRMVIRLDSDYIPGYLQEYIEKEPNFLKNTTKCDKIWKIEKL